MSLVELKFGHTADGHVRKADKDEILRILKFIFEDCDKRNVKGILYPGDLFDGSITLGNDGPLNELLDLIFSSVHQPFYLLQGTPSHDRPGAIKIFDRLRGFGRNIYVMENPISYPLVISGLQEHVYPAWDLDPSDGLPCGHISFLPALTKNYLAFDLKGTPEEINNGIRDKLRAILAGFAMAAADSPRPHILCGHFTVVGAKTSTGQTMTGGDISISVADLELAKADYVALGHIHEASQPNLPDYISYAGSPLHLNAGELTPRGYKVVTFNENGSLKDVEFIRTPSTPRQIIDVFITEEGINWADKICGEANVTIRVQGPDHLLTEVKMGEIEKLIAGINPVSVKMEKIITAETRVRAAELTNAKTLRAKLIEYGNAKGVDISESILLKADQLEEAIA